MSSVESSRATADLGAILWKQEAGALTGQEAKTAKNISKHVGFLEEFGQTYFVGQGREVEIGMIERKATFNQAAYSRIPIEGVENAGSNFIIPSNILGKLEVDAINDAGEKTGERVLIGSEAYLKQANHTVHYSLPSASGQEDVVNLRFHHGFSSGEAEAIAESEDLVRQTLRHIASDIPVDNEMGIHPLAQISQSMKASNIDISTKQVSQIIMGGEDLVIPEGAEAAYETIVGQLGKTLRERGVIGFTVKGKAGTQLRETLEHTMPEIFFGQNTDVEAAKNPGRITRFFHDMLGVEVSPMKNQEAAVAIEAMLPDPEMAGVSAERAAQLTARKADEAAQAARSATANVLAEDSNLVKALKINKAFEEKDKFRPFAIRAEEMWSKNRGKVAIGAAIVGTALFARHLSKKHRENQQYESTMMMSEPEEGQRPYGAQEALLNAKAPQSNSDPLATAGVVGNLDRRKVGHTNMSPQKNAHLFRG